MNVEPLHHAREMLTHTNRSIHLVCTTATSLLHWVSLLSVSFTLLPHWPLTPQLVLHVQIPKIMELVPNRGPVSGGTIVNITGSHLDAGSNVSVMFKDQPCTFLRLVQADQSRPATEKKSIWMKLHSVINHRFLPSHQSRKHVLLSVFENGIDFWETPEYHLSLIDTQFMSSQYVLHVQLSKRSTVKK